MILNMPISIQSIRSIYPTPTAPRTTLCTAHLAICPATATATALRYPHPSSIYNASILLNNTRCVSTTPNESKLANTPNNPVTYLVGRYGLRLDSAAARNDSRKDGDTSSLWESAALDAPRSFRVIGVRDVWCGGEVVSWVLRPLPSAPQITRRMGKSFAQLLTRRAVLIAVGLAAVGGGRGWMFCGGAVEVRRRGGGRCCGAGG